jgi:uncharacterized protein
VTDFSLPLARLGGALRAHGVGTSLRDELDAAQALPLIDAADRAELKTTLRIALKIPREHFGLFEQLFDAFWSGQPQPRRVADAPTSQKARPPSRNAEPRWDPELGRMADAAGTQAEGDRPGYSGAALLRRKRFDAASWSPQDMARMERLLLRLARRLATRRSRRLVPTRGRGWPDLRASYRRALRTSGELFQLARRARAIDEPRLVFLCDTSGSMDTHTRFLLSFVLSLRRAARAAEVFAFNTELVRLTPALAPGKIALSLERMSHSVPDWSGGTRIGECLAAFVAQHLERRVDARTVVVIFSDGLDRGDPELLAESVRRIQRRAKKLIWLNPLLGDPDYEPIARGMQAALPFVDHFASAHDLASLERLLPELS